jgi:hypothetical protein
MHKIKLTLTTEKLSIVNKAWKLITKNGLQTVEQKLLYDLTSKLSKKFKKKFIEKEFVAVEFVMTIEYNEAYFLKKALEILLDNINPLETPFEYNVVFKMLIYLNQKLC